MSEVTNIEWCDSTFNPFIGCTKVSPGCDNCYAEHLMDKRMHRVVWGTKDRVRTSPENWRKPLAWNRDAEKFYSQHRRRQRVFCASLSDVFDNAVEPSWRADLFDLIERTPNLDWLLLTKRIGNVRTMIGETLGRRSAFERPHEPSLPDNVWLGATIVNQEEADRDIPKLLAVPARVRFLSMEPLLESVDIRNYLRQCGTSFQAEPPCIDWVIVGGESGPNARPMHPMWARTLRDQCGDAGVPFLYKQHGEWRHVPEFTDARAALLHRFEDGTWVQRMGKKAAGRLLDGRTHNEFPKGQGF